MADAQLYLENKDDYRWFLKAFTAVIIIQMLTIAFSCSKKDIEKSYEGA